MNILIVGDWQYSMYEQAFADALSQLGHRVFKFSWSEYYSSLLGKVEYKYSLPIYHIRRFNHSLLNAIRRIKPEIVLAWRATTILPKTFKSIRAVGVRLIASYNHDDFTGITVGAPVPKHHYLHWQLFLKTANHYDCHFVKRQSNKQHLENIGSHNNYIMPMWFVPNIHRPFDLTSDERCKYSCDVIFIGHYEPDDRVLYLRKLVGLGLSVKLFGDRRNWNHKIPSDLYDYFSPIQPVYGTEYSKALCGAKICLAFLSKLNRDTYTRRCFEIPACGRVMLAERTDDLLNMFKEDREACFFSNCEELLTKAKWLIENPAIAESIAQAGLRRVWSDGHDVKGRVQFFIETIQEHM